MFCLPARFVYTNKSKDGSELIAKSRMVIPGHVDPDGEKLVDEGGFRTDAPTASQTSLHLFLSPAVRSKWLIESFDVNNACLFGG